MTRAAWVDHQKQSLESCRCLVLNLHILGNNFLRNRQNKYQNLGR